MFKNYSFAYMYIKIQSALNRNKNSMEIGAIK